MFGGKRVLKSWQSGLQGHHCSEGIGLMALPCTLSWNAVLIRESHTERKSMCDEWLFGPGSQEYLIMCGLVSPVLSFFRAVQAYDATVPNVDLIVAPFVGFFGRHFALVF